jgi:hypothetical protein
VCGRCVQEQQAHVEPRQHWQHCVLYPIVCVVFHLTRVCRILLVQHREIYSYFTVNGCFAAGSTGSGS